MSLRVGAGHDAGAASRDSSAGRGGGGGGGCSPGLDWRLGEDCGQERPSRQATDERGRTAPLPAGERGGGGSGPDGRQHQSREGGEASGGPPGQRHHLTAPRAATSAVIAGVLWPTGKSVPFGESAGGKAAVSNSSRGKLFSSFFFLGGGGGVTRMCVRAHACVRACVRARERTFAYACHCVARTDPPHRFGRGGVGRPVSGRWARLGPG